MPKAEWPEATLYTKKRAAAWTTTEAAVRTARTNLRELRAAADECWKTFRGAARHDFMEQCGRPPTEDEFHRYCSEILANLA